MKKFISILMVILLVLAVGAPAFAAPPTMSMSKGSYSYASAVWEIGSWDDPDNFVAYEVYVDQSGNSPAILCFTEYRLEYYEYEPGIGEYWPVPVDSFCQSLRSDQFNLTKKTIKNDFVIDLATDRGLIHVVWTVLESRDFRTKIMENYDKTRYITSQKGTESTCMVSGEIFGTSVNPENTSFSYGSLVIASYMYKQRN